MNTPIPFNDIERQEYEALLLVAEDCERILNSDECLVTAAQAGKLPILMIDWRKLAAKRMAATTQCESETYERFISANTRCKKPKGHNGRHDDGALTWEDTATYGQCSCGQEFVLYDNRPSCPVCHPPLATARVLGRLADGLDAILALAKEHVANTATLSHAEAIKLGLDAVSDFAVSGHPDTQLLRALAVEVDLIPENKRAALLDMFSMTLGATLVGRITELLNEGREGT